MKKQIIVLTIVGLSLLYSVSALPAALTFSNMIVFGDSLSDVGNFPEDPIPYDLKREGSLLDKYNPFYYVPLSNPVNIQFPKAYFSPIPKDESYTITFLKFFPAFNQHRYDATFREKKSYSANWSQFFLTDAFYDGLTKSQYLIPSTYIEQPQTYIATKNPLSFNYAFNSALSLKGCFNLKGKKLSRHCNVSIMMNSVKNFYENKETAYDQKINSFLIPGLLSQINIFIEDVNSQRVTVDSDTLYLIWIGGNDLNNNFKNLAKLKEKEVRSKLFKLGWQNFQAIQTLITSKGIQGEKIALFNLFDVTLMPDIHNWPDEKTRAAAQVLGKIIVNIYNEELDFIANAMIPALYSKKRDELNIKLIDIYTWVNQLAKDKRFNQYPYQACETSDPNYIKEKPPLANCKGYMFWNGKHLSMAMHQVIGYSVEQTFMKDILYSNLDPNVARLCTTAYHKPLEMLDCYLSYIWSKYDPSLKKVLTKEK